MDKLAHEIKQFTEWIPYVHDDEASFIYTKINGNTLTTTLFIPTTNGVECEDLQCIFHNEKTLEINGTIMHLTDDTDYCELVRNVARNLIDIHVYLH
jgi:hypothetical protein